MQVVSKKSTNLRKTSMERDETEQSAAFLYTDFYPFLQSELCYASARKTGKYFIMKSSDAGKTFSAIFEKSAPAIYFDKAMFFKDEFSGIILHDSGEIIGTSDSGKSWSSCSQTSQRYNSTITDFYYFNNRLCLISKYDLPLYSDNLEEYGQRSEEAIFINIFHPSPSQITA